MRRRACCGLGRARAARGYRVRWSIARGPVARSFCNRNVSISRGFTSDGYENIRSYSTNHSVGGEMAYPPYIRARARELRVKNHLSLDELAEHLALPKTTIYYWIKDLPLGRDRRESPHNGTRAMQAKYRRLREAAYEQGQAEYDELAPACRRSATSWCFTSRRGTSEIETGSASGTPTRGWSRWRPVGYVVSRRSRSATPSSTTRIRTSRSFGRSGAHGSKSTDRIFDYSGSPTAGSFEGRTWRSEHGVLTVCVNDTALRARLQAWIDLVRDDWH